MYLVFDIGGSKMRMAKSLDGKTFSEPLIMPTPNNFEEGVARLAGGLNSLTKGQVPVAICGGVAGPLNRERDRLMRAPHLPDWVGKPLKAELESVLNAPVCLENDTALVGLGEAVVGAGRHHHVVAYITVSTGVGGVRIVNGNIDVHGYGFEPGHQIINFNDSLIGSCSCGGSGHLESYISGTDFTRRFGERPSESDANSEIWDVHARMLAYGLANTIVHWVPDVVVLGGSMMNVPGIQIETLKKYLAEVLIIYNTPPLLVKAALADVGGLHGSLAYLRRKLSLE